MIAVPDLASSREAMLQALSNQAAWRGHTMHVQHFLLTCPLSLNPCCLYGQPFDRPVTQGHWARSKTASQAQLKTAKKRQIMMQTVFDSWPHVACAAHQNYGIYRPSDPQSHTVLCQDHACDRTGQARSPHRAFCSVWMESCPAPAPGCCMGISALGLKQEHSSEAAAPQTQGRPFPRGKMGRHCL